MPDDSPTAGSRAVGFLYNVGMLLPWVERTFSFDFPEAHFPVVLDRLRGTEPRIAAKVSNLSRDVLIRRDGDKWSIQEHIGHLLDLDELHIGRLDDYASGLTVLRAADMTNRKTLEARHNERPVAHLLAAFASGRAAFIGRLEGWEEARWNLRAIHPRLHRPMRVIDMVYFVAEHDDHHLARMTELVRLFAGKDP